MPNTKIFLDLDDEIPFIVEKILNAKTERVILVIPEKAQVISSLSSIRLLKTSLARHEKLVIIACMDRFGKILATNAGFLVKNKVGEIDNSLWDSLSDNTEEVDEKEMYSYVDNIREGTVNSNNINKNNDNKESHNIYEDANRIDERESREEEHVEVEKAVENVIEDRKHTEEYIPNEVDSENEILNIESEVEKNSLEDLNESIEKNSEYTDTRLKSVNYGSFELFLGLDALTLYKSNNDTNNKKKLERKIDTISSLSGSGSGIIGEDLEVYSKKKI